METATLKATPRDAAKSEEGRGLALLLIDVINDLDFPGSQPLVRQALPMARAISALRKRVQAAGVPVIYVNDNFGRWQSDFQAQVNYCLRDDSPGKAMAELLRPGEPDYFVLNSVHSGFYSTSLDVLLRHLGASTLIVAGVAADICVLFTANDAYMRNSRLIVPSDCVASLSAPLRRSALEQMRVTLKADVSPLQALRLPGEAPAASRATARVGALR